MIFKMKFMSVGILFSLICFAYPPHVHSQENMNQLLNQMTLEEKVGQMTQLTLEAVSKAKNSDDPNDHQLDPAKLEDALVKHHVGSILNVVDRAFTVDHWHEVIQQIQTVAQKKTRLGIPILYGIDSIHGANYTLGATLFPQAIAMAATFNPELVKKEGEITALETRASGIPWIFYPVLDLGRQPLWPRFWETYGEDTYLASTLGEANVIGLQDGSEAKVAACGKHYVGYSFPLSGKDRTPAWIPERMLRELFLPPFAAAIRAGLPTVMVNSAEVNGIPGHANAYYLNKILRNELGFNGFTVSDWEDIKRLYTRDRIAVSPEDAVRIAVMAGVDMSMVPFDTSFHTFLVKLVREGKVPMERIDEAVGRILRLKYELGLFENPYPLRHLKNRIATDEATKANIQAAQEAITLLKNKPTKNEPLLPLSKQTRVFVTGPAADSLSALNGGWTITWQGNDEKSYPKDKLTILRAIENKIGKSQVSYVAGSGFDASIPNGVEEAVQAAQKADVAIICLGEPSYTETPGNIDNLSLSQYQIDLANAILDQGKPTILLMVEGRPRIISSLADRASGVVMAYLPGMEGGRAIADVLFGDVNPSGKLPFSYPRFPNSLIPYDHKPSEAVEGNTYRPLYPFGYGLSYTKFETSDLRTSVSTSPVSVSVSVSLKNVGSRSGKEAVLLYINDMYGSVTRPVRQLKRYQKITLDPGEQKTLTFTLTEHDLSFIGRDLRRIFEPGEFRVMIGDKEAKFAIPATN